MRVSSHKNQWSVQFLINYKQLACEETINFSWQVCHTLWCSVVNLQEVFAETCFTRLITVITNEKLEFGNNTKMNAKTSVSNKIHITLHLLVGPFLFVVVSMLNLHVVCDSFSIVTCLARPITIIPNEEIDWCIEPCGKHDHQLFFWACPIKWRERPLPATRSRGVTSVQTTDTCTYFEENKNHVLNDLQQEDSIYMYLLPLPVK